MQKKKKKKKKVHVSNLIDDDAFNLSIRVVDLYQ